MCSIYLGEILMFGNSRKDELEFTVYDVVSRNDILLDADWEGFIDFVFRHPKYEVMRIDCDGKHWRFNVIPRKCKGVPLSFVYNWEKLYKKDRSKLMEDILCEDIRFKLADFNLLKFSYLFYGVTTYLKSDDPVFKGRRIIIDMMNVGTLLAQKTIRMEFAIYGINIVIADDYYSYLECCLPNYCADDMKEIFSERECLLIANEICRRYKK